MGEPLDPEAAAAFLERACDRHGGTAAYEATATLALRLADVGGLLPWLKGVNRIYRAPSVVDLYPHRRRAVFGDFPLPGQVGIFDTGRVAIGQDAEARLDGPSHRRTFDGWGKSRTWWPEDAVYFFGYSLLHYAALPFSLRGRPLVDARRTRRGVELWCRFPAGADTHSAVEGFVFDESGLLIRHDYRAEIMGAVFNGAHVGHDHQRFGGLLIATRRTVYAKPWHYPVRGRLPIPVLTARLLPRDPA